MNPVAVYDFIDVGYPFRLRGAGNTQNDVGLVYPPVQHTLTSVVGGGGPSVASQVRLGQITVGGFSLHNRCGTTAAVGIGVRIPNGLWQAGQWVDATTTYTDDTTDAQDDGGSDFPLETLTDNDGIVIMSRVPFNAISIDVSVTSSSAAPVRAIRYSTIVSGTSAWGGPIVNAYSSVATTGQYVITGTTHANEGVWAFNLPADFTATTGLDGVLGTGIRTGMYAMNLRATTAPTAVAGVADSISLYRLHFLTESLADNGVYEAFFGASEGAMLPEGDALVAFFETANAGNRFTTFVRTRG